MPNELTEKKDGFVSLAEKQDISEIIKPLTKEIHLFDTYIAGTSYLADKTVLSEAKTGDKLLLRREDNKFDNNAVMILAEDGRKLGYIPEKDNLVFARLMDAGKLLIARVARIDTRGDFYQIAIGIYLVDF
ncbi:MAG: HIRAN domain-containing protein [Bulleidia sp.]|nr:HIRAN domain-containing protein [Bulleidia sp.]